jgi:ribosomal protein S18 acetylase RimI-like enzyme
MEIHVREARLADADFARSLYFETMRRMIEAKFGWDQRRQEESFAEWFDLEEAGIIVADGRDAGWMQTRTNEHEVFLGSLYVKPEMQRLGIGTHVVLELIGQCRRSSKALTLAVMKINPAIHLYERLGFRITHEDEYKFYMQASTVEVAEAGSQSY